MATGIPMARNFSLYDNQDVAEHAEHAEHEETIHTTPTQVPDGSAALQAPVSAAAEDGDDEMYEAAVLASFTSSAANDYGGPVAFDYGAASPDPSALDPYGAPALDPYGAPALDPYGAPALDPFGAPALDPHGSPVADAYGTPLFDAHSSGTTGAVATHGLTTFGGSEDHARSTGAVIETHWQAQAVDVDEPLSEENGAEDAGGRWQGIPHASTSDHGASGDHPNESHSDDHGEDEAAEDDAWAAAPPMQPAPAFAPVEELEDTQTRFAKLAKAGEEAQQAGSHDRAIQHFDSALAIPGVPLPMVGRVHCQLARCYEATSEARYCLKHMQAFVDCAEQFGDEELLCAALTHLGIIQYKTQDLLVALATHQRALSLAGILGDVGSQMRAHGNIGNVHAAQGHFHEAIIHHREQHNLAERLEDRQAAARAALNLESDYASLRKYAEASSYADEKKMKAFRRVTVSSTFGDHRPGRTVCAGWLVKHKGGNLAGPKARKETKRFCTIQNGIFSYSNTAAMTRRASRYVRLGDIQDVQPCEVYEDDNVASTASRSFRIRVHERAFYFSAATVAECKEWLDSFAKTRADVANFAGTMRGKMNTAASDMFTSQKPSNISLLSGGSSAASQLTALPSSSAPLEEAMSQAPDGFNDKNVDNPLFGDNSFDHIQQQDGEPDYLAPDTHTSSALGWWCGGMRVWSRRLMSGLLRALLRPRLAGQVRRGSFREERLLLLTYYPFLLLGYMSVDDEGVESDVKIVHIDVEEGEDESCPPTSSFMAGSLLPLCIKSYFSLLRLHCAGEPRW